ncbi:hypothetical protein JOM56_002741 [Amanita muscaria]
MLHIFRSLCNRRAAPRAPNSNAVELVAFPSEPPVAQFPVQNAMFQSAHNVDIGGNARFLNIAGDNVINDWHGGTHGLEKMERFVSFAAQFDSSAQDPERICHPGTRQDVLKRMKDWIDDSSSTERITWLHGPAGAGKSAIAQTIAKLCDRQKVAATFFFFRSDASRNDGNLLFPTLAYQLAFSIPAIKDHIVQSLHERPDLPTKSVETQFEHLIALPFRSLAEAASAPSSPVSVIDAVNQCRQLAPVIIIDGIDECTDEKLQQRFLKVIGNAVKNSSFPFRFLICSRPEAHIEDTLNKFKTLILPIDLAKLDDANRDIEKYLVEQFSCIASNRGLDPTWPGQDAIQNIIYKSSGNFILASVVIKVTGDEDSIPEEQLAIILNLKPPDRMSPFAVLDELYLGILRRQLYQDFLKTFLALLVGRTALSQEDLREDDAKLMNMSEKDLHTKLRRMRSLLKFEPYIDVHHQSFLDFLQEPSRSGDYHVSRHRGTKRYLELVVDSIVLYVSRVIQNPNYHETHHLDLTFTDSVNRYLLGIDLPVEELRDVSRPLVQIQDEILKLPDSCIASNLLTCHKCPVFNIIRPLLLHLAIHRCINAAHHEVNKSVTKGKSTAVIPSFRPEAIQNALGNDLDNSLSSLLAHLEETKLELSPSTTIINHTYSILRFDCAETVVKVRSMSDAQRLVDFLVYLIDEKYILSQYKPNGMSKAAQLVLNIFLWVPILPQSLFLNLKRISHTSEAWLAHVHNACRSALMWRVLDQHYIHLEITLQGASLIVGSPDLEVKWQEVLPLESITVIELALEVVRALQYLHSMGVGHCNGFDIKCVHLDLSPRPKIRIVAQFLDLINPCTRSTSEQSLYGDSVFNFGCFFYTVYFNIKLRRFDEKIEDRRRDIVERPSSPKIPEYVWQLIQRCCAEDPANRPTIDEVVKEMETWGT